MVTPPNPHNGPQPSPSEAASPQPGASFWWEDLTDEPIGPGMLIFWDSEAESYVDLFDLPEYVVADAQPPPGTGDSPQPPPTPRDGSSRSPGDFPGGDFLGDPGPADGPRRAASNPNIGMFTVLNDANLTDAANFARLVEWHAEKLVIALDPTAAAEAEADCYGVDERGMLSGSEFHGAILATGRKYVVAAYARSGGDPKKFAQLVNHARRLRDAGTARKLRAVAAGTIAELRAHKALPPGLVVKTRDDIDADLSVIGTPGGVLDLCSGKILPPFKARESFVLSSTGVSYDQEAQHDVIDEILPPVATLGDDSPGYYRARIIAFGMLNRPQREFMVEVCDEASGKSSFVNALAQGLGRAYVRTIRKEALQTPQYLHGATAHNGDLRHFKAPSRFVFAMEWSTSYDRPTVKSLSGGDIVTMRRITQEDECFSPTGHLWLMGNSGENCNAVLGVGGKDADSRAIRDRAKLLTRTRIPDKQQVLAVVGLNTPDFKRAALARIVEYTMAFGHLDFPEGIPSFADLLDKQALAETPQWKREWLPNVLEALPPPGAGIVPPSLGVLNKEVYADFRAWFDQFGEGEIPSPKAVGGAVVDHYPMPPPQKTTAQEPTSIHVKYVTAYRYLGWTLRG